MRQRGSRGRADSCFRTDTDSHYQPGGVATAASGSQGGDCFATPTPSDGCHTALDNQHRTAGLKDLADTATQVEVANARAVRASPIATAAVRRANPRRVVARIGSLADEIQCIATQQVQAHECQARSRPLTGIERDELFHRPERAAHPVQSGGASVRPAAHVENRGKLFGEFSRHWSWCIRNPSDLWLEIEWVTKYIYSADTRRPEAESYPLIDQFS